MPKVAKTRLGLPAVSRSRRSSARRSKVGMYRIIYTFYLQKYDDNTPARPRRPTEGNNTKQTNDDSVQLTIKLINSD